jgi:molecular chaperone Hsp33
MTDTTSPDSAGIEGGELHKFVFEGLPVRGMLVRLTGAWQQVLSARRESGEFAVPVRQLLGQMCAAATLLQANIKFNGALVMQIQGDGPVPLAVAEVQSDLSLRATARVTGEVPPEALLHDLVHQKGQGRCAITLDPRERQPGQQPYQGIVPLSWLDDEGREREPTALAEVIEHYMRQSEQLETRLVLAADDQGAAGLLIQRMPGTGGHAPADADEESADEAFQRIALLAGTLKAEELLTLDADTVLRRLFWELDLRRFEPLRGALGPRFACTCSRERVGRMLHGLGRSEAQAVIAEQGRIEVGCEFCGRRYEFDAVDVAGLFHENPSTPGSPTRH